MLVVVVLAAMAAAMAAEKAAEEALVGTPGVVKSQRNWHTGFRSKIGPPRLEVDALESDCTLCTAEGRPGSCLEPGTPSFPLPPSEQ